MKFIFPSRLFIISFCLLSGPHHFAFGEEEKAKLEIESEPDEFSADLCIAEAQGKPISDEEKERERKRTRFGAGELVKLRLSGKEALIEDPKKLVWRIEPRKGDNWAQIEVDDGNNPSLLVPVVLTINKDLVFDTSEAQDPEKEIGDTALQTEGELNVQVLQGEEIIAQKTFTAVLPSKITAEHEGRPVSGKDGEYGEGFPQDGDWEPAGASSVLNLTFHPTDVSFWNLAKIEVDHGFKKYDDNGQEVEFHKIPPSLIEVHRPLHLQRSSQNKMEAGII